MCPNDCKVRYTKYASYKQERRQRPRKENKICPVDARDI